MPRCRVTSPGRRSGATCSPGGNSSLYPADNFFPTVTTFYAQFVNYSAQNYALASGSPYIGRATDGKNIGVDLAALTRHAGSSGASTTTNAAPSANPGGPYSGRPGTAISFNGSGSRDPDGSIASYRWDWGDGTSAGSGATPSHTYASSGTFTVRLTVTDNAGATGAATTTASIQAPSTTGAGDIVLTAADVTVIRGNWARISSTTGARRADHVEHQQWLHPVRTCRLLHPPLLRGAIHGCREYELPDLAAPPRAERQQVRRLGVGAVHGRGVSQGAPLWRTGTTSGQLIDLEACAGCGISGWGWRKLDRGGSLPGRGTPDNPYPDAGGRRPGGSDCPQPGEVPDSRARLGRRMTGPCCREPARRSRRRTWCCAPTTPWSERETGCWRATAPLRMGAGLAASIRAGPS